MCVRVVVLAAPCLCQFDQLRACVLRVLAHGQLVERSVSSTQHTLHHNSLLMAQQQDESRLLRDKYRQLEALYRYQSSRAASMEAKLDEAIRDKLSLQHDIRQMRHESAAVAAARAGQQRAKGSRRGHATAAAAGMDGSRATAAVRSSARVEQQWTTMAETGTSYATMDDDDASMSTDDDERYPPLPLAILASPIRLGGGGQSEQRARVDLSPAAAASSRLHSLSSFHPSLLVSPRSTSSMPSDTRPLAYGGGGGGGSGPDTRPSFTSQARKYSSGHV